MSIVLSITGLIKTVLIIIGVFVILRFIGQIMQAKRNIAEQNEYKKHRDQIERERKFVEKNEGKILITKNKRNAEDVDYEEI